MNNYRQENVISTEGQSRHNIKRYEFKALDSTALESTTPPLENLEPLITPPAPSPASSEESEGEPSPAPSAPFPIAPLESELVERLLQRSDDVVDSLLKVQQQLERQQQEMEAIIKEAREEARALGFKEGQEQARQELQGEIEAQKNSLITSIELLERTSKEMEQQIGHLERDLSAIAVDIAKEVIVKEVENHSAEVARELATQLLESLKEATKILLKLNPQDYAALAKHFEGEERVKLQPDKAIAKGGVVIISDSGNLDGTILSRFQTLKKSILENLAERS